MNINICYWCGQKVLDVDGSREHLVPRTILQDTDSDVHEFIIPKINAHKKCNALLAREYEHDFCQILFHYAFDDPKAVKHRESKIRNLKRKPNYAKNQFAKMKKNNGKTEVGFSEKEKKSFEKIIEKIVKGLFFLKNNIYLDTKNKFILKTVWGTMNFEYDRSVQRISKMISRQLSSQEFAGNDVIKYRFEKAIDGNSYLWELIFYSRFPVYVFLISSNDKDRFNLISVN